MKIAVDPNWCVAEIEHAILNHSTVVFRSGRYALSRPICLEHVEDCTILGESGARICGGEVRTVSWETAGENVWRTHLECGRKVDALRIGDSSFRQARYPHATDSELIYEGTSADALNFASRCAHPEDGVLHALHKHMWGDVHYRIDGKNADGSLRLNGGWQNNRPMGIHEKYRFVENLREALGANGEFFYDPRTGELLVCAEEKPSDEILVITNPYLFKIRNCKNLRMENLILEDSARTFLENYEPLLRSDWCIHRGGALFVEDSQNVYVENCEFRHIGSNSLFFNGNVSDCTVKNCRIHDIGASGICFVGKPSSVRFPCTTVDADAFAPEDLEGIGPKDDQYVRDCAVENCLIQNVGTIEKQTACVEISMSARIQVAHCTMHTCPRAAVNISEGTFGGHIIEWNEMFDTVRETGDHGSFNAWGRDRFWHADNLDNEGKKRLALMDNVETTILRHNCVRCDHGWDIDLDDGCSNYLVEENLCLAGGLKFREGFCRTARKNRIINNTFHPHVWFENSDDVFEQNLVMRPYLPIGMPKTWGSKIDENTLAIRDDALRPAHELQQLSEQDENSVARPLNPSEVEHLFESGNEIFGVQNPDLRKHAKQCPIDAPSPMTAVASGQQWHLNDLAIKNVETDGEMSAYATPEHCGVIVLAIAPHNRWYLDGLRTEMAIISVNGQILENAEHLIHICDSLAADDEMVLGVRTMNNEAKDIHTQR